MLDAVTPLVAALAGVVGVWIGHFLVRGRELRAVRLTAYVGWMTAVRSMVSWVGPEPRPGDTIAIPHPDRLNAFNESTGDAEVLLVPRLDRLARKLTIQEAALAQAWKHGGRVIACDQGEIERDEPDDPVRTAMRQMMGVFAQLERGMVVARLRRGRQAKKDAGGYASGRPRFGYRPSRGALVEVPQEQAIIKKAMRLRKSGLSSRAIAARLDAEGDRPRTGWSLASGNGCQAS